MKAGAQANKLKMVCWLLACIAVARGSFSLLAFDRMHAMMQPCIPPMSEMHLIFALVSRMSVFRHILSGVALSARKKSARKLLNHRSRLILLFRASKRCGFVDSSCILIGTLPTRRICILTVSIILAGRYAGIIIWQLYYRY